ncbi:hypothetical protein EVAR_102632_1 [Eumeta japonica]|uniref:Uncharacterized protein n=1 Tax=Eumeta variegata TaxID=151549 RepID=A0A4C1TUQ9_EUMVA|nr:hypothetical protein EVAR_102632_1 [Eumeta japonica]
MQMRALINQKCGCGNSSGRRWVVGSGARDSPPLGTSDDRKHPARAPPAFLAPITPILPFRPPVGRTTQRLFISIPRVPGYVSKLDVELVCSNSDCGQIDQFIFKLTKSLLGSCLRELVKSLVLDFVTALGRRGGLNLTLPQPIKSVNIADRSNARRRFRRSRGLKLKRLLRIKIVGIAYQMSLKTTLKLHSVGLRPSAHFEFNEGTVRHLIKLRRVRNSLGCTLGAGHDEPPLPRKGWSVSRCSVQPSGLPVEMSLSVDIPTRSSMSKPTSTGKTFKTLKDPENTYK